MTGDENRVRLRKDVLMSLRGYLAENKKSVAGVPGVILKLFGWYSIQRKKIKHTPKKSLLWTRHAFYFVIYEN